MGPTSTRSFGQHDRLSDPQFEEQGVRLLDVLLRRFDQLHSVRRDFSGVAGSSLYGDDVATPYEPVSALVSAAVVVALDHLHAVKLAVESERATTGRLNILTLSMFTLVRSAFEALGTAIWLLTPRSRDERVLRALRLTYSGRYSVHEVNISLEDTVDTGYFYVLNRMEELRDHRPGLDGRSIKKLDTVTSRLDSVAEQLPHLVLPPLTMWRMASGLAHGNTSMIRAVLEHEQVTEFAQGSAEFRLTTSVGVFALFFASSIEMLEHLLRLHQSRNVPVANTLPGLFDSLFGNWWTSLSCRASHQPLAQP